MSVLSTLPLLAGALLVIVTVALDSEPPISNPQPENGIIANEPRTEPVMHTYTLPRVTANLEGDLSPVLFVTGLSFDFPAWEAAPDHIPDTGQMVAQVFAEPVRTPLPQISSVPVDCPPVFVEVFGVNAAAACNVARCESGFNVGAINARPPDDSHGLMQINMIGNLGPDRLLKLHALGYDVPDVPAAKVLLHTDAVANLRLAYVLSAGGTNFGAWSCRP